MSRRKPQGGAEVDRAVGGDHEVERVPGVDLPHGAALGGLGREDVEADGRGEARRDGDRPVRRLGALRQGREQHVDPVGLGLVGHEVAGGHVHDQLGRVGVFQLRGEPGLVEGQGVGAPAQRERGPQEQPLHGVASSR